MPSTLFIQTTTRQHPIRAERQVFTSYVANQWFASETSNQNTKNGKMDGFHTFLIYDANEMRCTLIEYVQVQCRPPTLTYTGIMLVISLAFQLAVQTNHFQTSPFSCRQRVEDLHHTKPPGGRLFNIVHQVYIYLHQRKRSVVRCTKTFRHCSARTHDTGQKAFCIYLAPPCFGHISSPVMLSFSRLTYKASESLSS